MNFIRTIILLLFFVSLGFGQSQTNDRTGNLCFYWGWNRAWYSNSNISFSGENYDFTLKEVIANDRQSDFDPGIYFVPTKASIPQYNFRIGYFLTNNYNISFGIDHMKYVVEQNQVVKISGNISDTGTDFDGTYNDDDMNLCEDFLQFEHTDGLNYVNLEVRRFDEIFDFNKIKINFTGGLGLGILMPRTNTVLLNNERYDEFHFSGYGINGIVGINVSIIELFFVQTEFKGGFINMPDIRTTGSDSDQASQHFVFSQLNIVFGVTINL